MRCSSPWLFIPAEKGTGATITLNRKINNSRRSMESRSFAAANYSFFEDKDAARGIIGNKYLLSNLRARRGPLALVGWGEAKNDDNNFINHNNVKVIQEREKTIKMTFQFFFIPSPFSLSLSAVDCPPRFRVSLIFRPALSQCLSRNKKKCLCLGH